MEVPAAMVEPLDQDVERVIAALKTRGCHDDTIILFPSDNGPMDNVTEQFVPRSKAPIPRPRRPTHRSASTNTWPISGR